MTPNTDTVKHKGRQPGQRVQSLDYRAYKALRNVDFARFVDMANSSEADDWRDELIELVISTLREKDIF